MLLERPAVSVAGVSEEIDVKVGQIPAPLLPLSPFPRLSGFRVKFREASKIDGFCRNIAVLLICRSRSRASAKSSRIRPTTNGGA